MKVSFFMDDAKAIEARQWLLKAQQDLKVACLLFETQEAVLSAVVYHCQQAVEKGLKAYLTDQGLRFPKTHDLTILLALCVSVDGCFEVLQDTAVILTAYATEFRYPADVMEPEREESKQAIDMAENTIQLVMNSLPNTGETIGRAGTGIGG